jgi:poly-gamma-glutamate capsule biosynthesis protein CapA/YwtB (metallophosphatase superfamily)
VAVRRFRLRALPVLLVALSTAACGGAAEPGSNRQPDSPTGGGAPTRTAPQAAVTVDATISPEARPVRIAFAGDVHFEGQLRGLLDDPETALAPVAPQLAAADLAVLNLESAVGTGGTREPKRFTFQAPPTAFEALAAGGVDVVTMANNHAGDFGFDGIAEAVDAAAAMAEADPPLAVIGIGANAAAAFEPARFDIDGTTVAMLGASAADDDPTADPTGHWAATDDRAGVAMALEPDRLVAAVAGAAAEYDVVVVYLHFGIQGQSCPSEPQAALARAVADAGAPIVVGSHAHRLQGAGLLGDTYVAYGLGNFVWYTQASEATTTTGVLTLTIDGGAVTEEAWTPARIGSDGLPRFTEGAEAAQMTEDFRALRNCTDLEPL